MSSRPRNTRTWTDDDLRAAIPTATSWSGLLKELGLCHTSAGSRHAVRRRAEKLGLSTEHFQRNRKWGDAELRRALPDSATWPELLNTLGLASLSTNSRASVRARCLKLGLSMEHLDRAARSKSRHPTPRLPIDFGQLRYAAPGVATAWFFMRGCMVSVPAEQAPYDLLVEIPEEGVKKVQVKSTTRKDSNGGFQVGIAPIRTHGPQRYINVPYDPADVDLFFIVDGDGRVYLIPMVAVVGLSTLSLNAYRRYECGSAGGLLGVSATVDVLADEADDGGLVAALGGFRRGGPGRSRWRRWGGRDAADRGTR